MRSKIYLLAELLLTSVISLSQVGMLDPTFNGDGKATTPIGTASEGRAIAVQSDGKIVVAGISFNGSNNDFALTRYNTDGTLDATFDGDGKVITAIGTSTDEVVSIALQSDGKIVVAGYSHNGNNQDFALARYNMDGTLDATFDGDGKVTTAFGTSSDFAYSVAVQNDGKIVLAGYSYIGINYDFALIRYNTDGSLDATFGIGGKVTTAFGTSSDFAYSVAVQNDGKIVVAGFSLIGITNDFAIARYNTDGMLDATFEGNGKVTTAIGTSHDFAYSVAVKNDGKIVVAGYSHNGSNNDFALAIYNSDGTLDNTFDGDGKVTTSIGTSTDVAYSVAVQNDGKIVVAGYSHNGSNNDFALARYNTDGALDATFDGDGKLVTDFANSGDQGFAMKLSGLRIYVSGVSNNEIAVAAYMNDAAPLPLSLTSFIASKNNSSIQLNWKTANEQNISYFEIQRNADARTFTKLGKVQSSGNSSSTKNYSFTDMQPLRSTNFYQLKMVDKDGLYTYSKVVAVNMNPITKGLQLFPNPVKGILHVQATGVNETATLQITDAAGRIVQQQNVQLQGSTSFSVDVQSLSKGKYYLLLQRKESNDLQEFVKQ